MLCDFKIFNDLHKVHIKETALWSTPLNPSKIVFIIWGFGLINFYDKPCKEFPKFILSFHYYYWRPHYMFLYIGSIWSTCWDFWRLIITNKVLITTVLYSCTSKRLVVHFLLWKKFYFHNDLGLLVYPVLQKVLIAA